METVSRYFFFNQKRVNVCEHTTKKASLESLRKVPPGGCERDRRREIMVSECELKMSELNL